jgi:hypothetical protein
VLIPLIGRTVSHMSDSPKRFCEPSGERLGEPAGRGRVSWLNQSLGPAPRAGGTFAARIGVSRREKEPN